VSSLARFDTPLRFEHGERLPCHYAPDDVVHAEIGSLGNERPVRDDQISRLALPGRLLTWEHFNALLERFPLPSTRITHWRETSLAALGNLREEPSAGKSHARIRGGESRVAELPDQPLPPECAR
jgi:hypothetical protein